VISREKEKEMAGIKEAMKRVMDGKNLGHVVAIGDLNEAVKCTCDEGGTCEYCTKTKYIIIRLEDGGLITQYDYNGDVGIADDVEVKDYVVLMILDNWNAEWQRTNLTRTLEVKKES